MVIGSSISTDEHRKQVNSFEGQIWLAHVPLSHKEDILGNTLQIGFQALSCGMLLTLLCLQHHVSLITAGVVNACMKCLTL